MKSNVMSIAIFGVCLSFTAAALAAPCKVEGAVALTPEMLKSGSGEVKVIFKPRPDYPKEARVNHWTGAGCFLMHVAPETGAVESVDMIKSTGHKILDDDEVIRTLSRWRFARGGSSKVTFPVTFRMTEN